VPIQTSVMPQSPKTVQMLPHGLSDEVLT
jgi:hypothetical protein